jgi:hypothetical protein
MSFCLLKYLIFKNVGVEKVIGGWVQWWCRLLKGSIIMSHLLYFKNIWLHSMWILTNLIVILLFINFILLWQHIPTRMHLSRRLCSIWPNLIVTRSWHGRLLSVEVVWTKGGAFPMAVRPMRAYSNYDYLIKLLVIDNTSDFLHLHVSSPCSPSRNI